MSQIALITLYTLMLAFDLAVLAGTAHLIDSRGWSGWWLLVAVFICSGSSPRWVVDAALKARKAGAA